MTRFPIGQTPEHQPLKFNLVPKATKHTLLMGISGSGKSNLIENFAKEISEIQFEETTEKSNLIVFDTEMEFGRLRRYDPDFLIVANDGDIPISIKSAEDLGRLSRIHRLSLIIQLSSLHTELERQKYIGKFLFGVSEVEQKYWKSTVIIIDESQEYCSLTGTDSRDAIMNICHTGRKRGITMILATQGLKDLYHKARKQCSNRLVGYIDDPDDRIIACELLDLDKKESHVFREFGEQEPVGRFYARGPNISVRPVIFRAELLSKDENEKYDIPEPSQKGLALATMIRNLLAIPGALRERLGNKNIEADAKAQDVSDSELREAYLKGWQEATHEAKAAMEEIVKTYEKNIGFMGMFRKPVQIKFIRVAKELDGRERFEA